MFLQSAPRFRVLKLGVMEVLLYGDGRSGGHDAEAEEDENEDVMHRIGG